MRTRDSPSGEASLPLPGEDRADVLWAHVLHLSTPDDRGDVRFEPLPVKLQRALGTLSRCNECLGHRTQVRRGEATAPSRLTVREVAEEFFAVG